MNRKRTKTNAINADILDIGLSIRAINVCRNNDINTVKDLTNTTREKFIKFKYAGKKTIMEIEEFFRDNGLDWKL